MAEEKETKKTTSSKSTSSSTKKASSSSKSTSSSSTKSSTTKKSTSSTKSTTTKKTTSTESRKVTVQLSDTKKATINLPSEKTVSDIKKVAKVVKKNKQLWPVFIVIGIIAICAAIYIMVVNDNPYYFIDMFIQIEDISDTVVYTKEQTVGDGIKLEMETVNDEFQMYFLEVGNEFTGDSVYIKAGDYDILIDAGSRNSSSTAIKNFIEQPGRVEDNKLEFVIATHAHQDHIAGFVGTQANPGIFDLFECETIIDFARTNSSTALYKSYCDLRDKEVQAGATHYTALQCYKETDGAQRVYQLTQNISLEILYNYYYENKTSNENNYSVCVMLNHGDRHFLLTGDLESGGEKKLVQNNKLPECELYKGGHHGSYTAGSYDLLQVIKPKIVCICCCAGSDEYTSNAERMFPAQDFITRIAKFTDLVFATTVISDEEPGYTALNGTITISSLHSQVVINCSNNNTLLKDSEWFKKNRKWE